MITLKAEKRDHKLKAKRLRREGFTTGVLFGKDMQDSIPLQFAEKEASRFVKDNKEGTQVILEIGEEKTSAIVKNIDYDSMKGQILALDFQALVSGEKISTTAPIKLLNDDSVQGAIEQQLTEVHYKAEPANLIDIIEIDLKELGPDVKNLYLRDLKLDEKNIDVTTPGDALIFHIQDFSKNVVEEVAVDAGAESGAASV